MSKIYTNTGQLIGNTPIMRLDALSQKYNLLAPIIAKLEMFNPSGSLKDRAAWHMLTSAMARGELSTGGTVIEATAGNGGLSLAMCCAILNLNLILLMPDNVPSQRIEHVELYGAKVITFPSSGGSAVSDAALSKLIAAYPNSFLPKQFENEDNCTAHRQTTAMELIDALGSIDYFIAGVGTGGTVTGCGEIIKMHCPDCRLIAVEPVDSPVISGGFAGAHALAGIGAGFIPEILNTYILDEVIRVRTPDSIALLRDLAKTEGLLCGISSGAALAAAVSVAQRPETRGKTIVTILPDTGERYLGQI